MSIRDSYTARAIMRFTAVLFDLDGTLLNTLDDLADSMNAVLASRGYQTHPTEEYRWFVGDGVELLVRRTLPRTLQDDEPVVESCRSQMRDEYGRRWKNRSRPYPGVPALLDGLAERAVRMAILSNKPDAFVGEIARHFFGSWTFAAAWGARPEIPRKPDPTAALAIAHEVGAEPGSFLYVGDTNTDMETALAAGMFPVGALWGFRDERELREAGARVLAARPADVLDLL
ncbi:MAG TPA: HAD family hydrolase [Spirochaetia bacterium]|nr:HAD family hydrolase [Spirochaetia bacterium]